MILWLNPCSGVSGDMLLGALIGLGAPVGGIRDAISQTGLTGWRLEHEDVQAGGIRATGVQVHVDDESTERHAAELLDLVHLARPEPVTAVAAEAVRAIRDVEAHLHDSDPDRVHLHEIGGHDTVVDTVGVAAALHLLGITEVRSAPVGVGSGTVRCAHGVLPAPAPATLALLNGAQTVGIDVRGETVTPTGAALLRAAGTTYGPPPAMTVRANAFGAGTKVFPGRPNVLSAVLGEPVDPPPLPGLGVGEQLLLLETNVDDISGEVLGHVIASALNRGAADAWCTPTVMKKGRPAHEIHVLCRPDRAPALEELLLAETGSLGLRTTTVQRRALPREFRTVTVRGHDVRIKHGPWHAKPEYDDLAAAATALGLPLREVTELALTQAAQDPDTGAPTDPHRLWWRHPRLP